MVDRFLLEGGVQKLGEVEQAKKTGGMVALYARRDDNDKLVVEGGEEADELHCTVIYLGEDVRDEDPTELIAHLDYVADNFQEIQAQVFAHALFNPDGDEPCAVYLVGGTPDLTGLYRELKDFVVQRYPGAKEQHDPYIPHVTAGYGLDIKDLTYTGPVTFDRIGLRWPDHDDDWTL